MEDELKAGHAVLPASETHDCAAMVLDEGPASALLRGGHKRPRGT